MEILTAQNGHDIPERMYLAVDIIAHGPSGVDAGAPGQGAAVRRLEREAAQQLWQQLSRHAGLADSDFSIQRHPGGKPYARANSRQYGASLTHSRNRICAGLYLDGEIGVDMEPVDRRIHPGLQRRIRSGTDPLSIPVLQLWTMKEAVLKFTGSGLRFSMQNIHIEPLHGSLYQAWFTGRQAGLRSFTFNGCWVSVAYGAHE